MPTYCVVPFKFLKNELCKVISNAEISGDLGKFQIG